MSGSPVEHAVTSGNMKRPTGTVTFLFSDIEGSTAILGRIGEDSYAQTLADHHQIIRSALVAHGGTEVDTQGDGFFALFSSTRACAAAVTEMQRSLASHEWSEEEQVRVRMGIHAGEASERTTGLVGFDIHKAARVAAAANGGQVLLSETAAALVRDFLPGGTSLRDLGFHRLKDLGRPEQIFQLDIEGLSDEFPPIRSLDNPELQNNLPAQLSSFVGRETELKEITALVETSRLVTLTGAGGSGKTRLALQAAAELLDGSGEGVWFVDLAPLADPGLVATTVAQAIGVREESGRPVADALVDAVGDRRLLIVLDNCEHLIDSCAKLTDTLLRSCRKVHVLATSREPLAIDGEQVYRVPTLSLPAGDRPATDSEAVRLFVRRATETRPDFTLDEHTSITVASICRQLDGMPLAIELAAARVSSMDISDIEARLDKRFSLLRSANRTALPRQQTLRALVDWSYDLLTDHDRSTLCRLSVFSGGWDLAAAEAVCADEDTDVFEVTDVLGSLVDKSLVQTDTTTFGLRYRLLETIRQFAAEKLAEQNDDKLAAEYAHAQFFLAFAEQAAPELRGPQQAQWLERLEADHDNLRAAIDRRLADPDAGSEILCILVRLSRFFGTRHQREGVNVLTAALGHTGAGSPTALRAEALGALGDLMEGRERRLRIEEGLSIARALGDPTLTAEILVSLSWCMFQEGELVGCAGLAEEAVALARRVGDPGLLGRALTRRAIAVGIEDPQEACFVSEEALTFLRLAGDRGWEGRALCNLGNYQLGMGDTRTATVHFSEALAIHEEMRSDLQVETIMGCLAEVALIEGDLASARQLYSSGLRIAYREGARRDMAYLVLGLAQCFSDNSASRERAALLLGAADAQNDLLGLPWEIQPAIVDRREERQAQLKQLMGEQAFHKAYAHGRGLTLDAAVALALEAVS